MKRFHFGAIPESDFKLGESWKPMREPGPLLMQCFALPTGVGACAVFVMLWLHLTDVTKSPVARPLLLSLVLLAVFPVHEFIHIAAHPGWGFSQHSIIGFWPSRMLAYAHYDGVLSRNRFIAILAMPLIVISVGLLLVCAVIGNASVAVAFASCFNALGAGGDLSAIGMLIFQVPNRACVVNKGWRTYWTLSCDEPGRRSTKSKLTLNDLG
jgi:hypothetical protein